MDNLEPTFAGNISEDMGDPAPECEPSDGKAAVDRGTQIRTEPPAGRGKEARPCGNTVTFRRSLSFFTTFGLAWPPVC
jgi:hypothetical protein